MQLRRQFEEYNTREGLFTSRDVLLLAVSGGIDSVVLCELCRQSGYRFVIAHCNFKLRGAESERDAAFVTQLAAKYEVPLLTQDFDTEDYAKARKVSVQVAARELRYTWFESIIRGEVSADAFALPAAGEKAIAGNRQPVAKDRPKWIVTAHHRDDNIETLLMNFFKGTGIGGLRGMLPKQGNIVRPLLFASKEALQQFALAEQLAWVEDSSNALDKYARNYVRHQVLPLLAQIYPGVEENLGANLQRFREVEILYRESIERHKRKLLFPVGNEIHIPVLKLKKTLATVTILYEIMKFYGFSPAQATEMMGLLDGESGKYLQSDTHRVIRNRQWLIIAPRNTTEAQHLLIEGVGDWPFPLGTIGCSLIAPPAAPAGEEAVAMLDAGLITFPLLLRPWAQGDYFYPLGMTKKKKVARFLIDQKVSKTDKEKVWVLEMDKKIIWVVGKRIDNRFKTGPSTAQVLRIALKTG